MNDDLFLPLLESGSSDSVDDPDPVESSGVSALSSPAAPVRRPAGSIPVDHTASKQKSYKCDKPQCRNRKPYKTFYHYDRHMAAHDVADINQKMPSAEAFTAVIGDLITKVLLKLLEDHRLGSDAKSKVDFIQEVLNSKLHDKTWTAFVNAVSKPLVRCLSEPSKLLPLNRYEECQTKLNHALNDEGAMGSLTRVLQIVSDKVQLSDALARRLVFRIAFLLLDEIQLFIAREMQDPPSSSAQSSQSGPLSDEEIVELKERLAGLFRSFVQRGLEKEANSRMWRAICRCMKEKFVDEPVDSQSFLSKDLWYNKDDLEDSIYVSPVVVDFFVIVESVTKLHPEEGKPLKYRSLDDVLLQIHNHRGAMESWFFLTHAYFSEEDSLFVMKLIVSAFRETLVRLESKKLSELALERSRSKSGVAIRTNLKRD